MIEPWIALTVGAAFLQNLRSMLQKSMKGALGTTGATFVRFLYALPVAALYLVLAVHGTGTPLPEIGGDFLLYAAVGGLAQITGTALLVSLFDQRSFAVATTFSKTETVQAAVFALVILQEAVSIAAMIGIAVSFAGIVAISLARRPAASGESGGAWRLRAALVGLGSGAAFGLAAVAYRGASLSLDGEGFVVRSSLTLLCVLIFQVFVMGGYMLLRARTELVACFRTWRVASLVGVSGALASAGWFGAMTLENAALVRSVGQIELVFTLASSVFFFREKVLRLELWGIALVTGGILILLQG